MEEAGFANVKTYVFMGNSLKNVCFLLKGVYSLTN